MPENPLAVALMVFFGVIGLAVIVAAVTTTIKHGGILQAADALEKEERERKEAKDSRKSA